MPLAILLLAGTAPLLGGAFLFATLFGLGSGLTSIVRGIVPLSLFGSEGYGARLGRMTSVRLVMTALGPFAFALTLAYCGANAALGLLALAGAAGLLALFEIERLRRK